MRIQRFPRNSQGFVSAQDPAQRDQSLVSHLTGKASRRCECTWGPSLDTGHSRLHCLSLRGWGGREGYTLKTKPVALALAVSATFGYAQAQSVQTLDTVVVTASRMEELLDSRVEHVKVITRSEIDGSGVSSVPEALDRLAGVNVRGTALGQLGLNATIDIGGHGVTAPGNTLILLDGVRLNPIDSSEVSWGVIPVSDIERIEVLEGPASVQFGAGASGGVINIVSQRNSDANGEWRFRSGSHGTTSLSLSTPLTEFGRLRISSNHSDGWRHNSQAESLNLSWDRRLTIGSSGLLNFRAFTGQSETALPGGVVGMVGSGDRRAVKFNNVDSKTIGTNLGLAVDGLHQYSDVIDGLWTVSYIERSSEFQQPYNDRAASVDALNGYIGGPAQTWLNTKEITVAPRIHFAWSDLAKSTIGLEVMRASQDSHNRFGPDAQNVILANSWGSYYNNIISDVTDAKVLNQSIYLSHSAEVLNRGRLKLGFRRQLQSVDLWDLNKSTSGSSVSVGRGATGANAYDMSFSYLINSATSTFFKAASSYRFANTDEFWGSNPNDFSRIFSGVLKPQETRSIEVGGSYSLNQTLLRISVSDAVTSNEIRYNPSTYSNSNLTDEIRRRQLGASMGYSIGSTGRLKASYRYILAEYEDGSYSGQSIGLVPKHLGTLSYTQKFGNKSSIGIVSKYTGQQTYDASPSVPASKTKIPSYFLTDISIQQSYSKSLEVSLTVKNLFDKRYSTYGGYGYVIVGDNAVGSSSYYHFPSDPRSIYISVTGHF